VRLSLVVNIVPDDNIIKTSSDGPTDGKDEPSIKRTFQQITDFTALAVVRQECCTNCSTEPLAGMRMLLLQLP